MELPPSSQEIADVIAEAVELTQRQVRNILAETPPEEITATNDNLPASEQRRGDHIGRRKA